MRKVILIGASTGGPGHIKYLLQNLDLNNSVVVIAQHMQASFLPSYANQLNKECLSEVVLLENPCFLDDKKIYICQHNTELFSNLRANFNNGVFPFCPNVDLLFNSASKLTKDYEILAILLTGIGDDGAKGLFELYKKGAKCIGESEKSCIVYGMPKRAYELNNNLLQLDINNIRKEILAFVR
ncbi:CheB methylesterase domain-containing protein [Campylobacter sp. MG1]|uniref:CheB methylesterase domain-containing protein n=1 Tax=Campylobacter sp. MG1 TaxID=2976332 RepID=UPI00226C6DA0|nr:CheB methylesterase domain-containing protein [Campylobacter sp. MG1]